MYTWASLFIFCVYIMTCQIISSGRIKYYFFFLFFAILSAYTHYYALVAAGLLAIGIWTHCIFQKKNILLMASISLMGVMSYLPWLKVLIESFKRTSDHWCVNVIPTMTECLDYVFGYRWLWIEILICLVIYTLYKTNILEVKSDNKEEKKYCVHINNPNSCDDELICSIIGISVVFGLFLTGIIVSKLISPLFMTRYGLVVSLIGYFLFANFIKKLKSNKIVVIFTVIIVFALGIISFRDRL